MAVEFSHRDLQSYTMNFAVLIGKGSSGRVFIGRISQENPYGLEEQVIAVKRVSYGTHDIHRATWRMEVVVLSGIDHPNIIRMVGYSEYPAEKLLFLVLEHVPLGNLRRRLEELDWETTLKVAIGIARGVEHLHWLPGNIIHRDLKSENILLAEDFTPKICDFGLAQKDTLPYIRVPLVGPYQSYDGAHKVRESDIYSYGCILRELISKQLMQEADKNRSAKVHDVLKGQGCGPKTSKKIINLIKRCMGTRHKRPSALQIVEILQAVQAEPEDVNEAGGYIITTARNFMRSLNCLGLFGVVFATSYAAYQYRILGL